MLEKGKVLNVFGELVECRSRQDVTFKREKKKLLLLLVDELIWIERLRQQEERKTVNQQSVAKGNGISLPTNRNSI